MRYKPLIKARTSSAVDCLTVDTSVAIDMVYFQKGIDVFMAAGTFHAIMLKNLEPYSLMEALIIGILSGSSHRLSFDDMSCSIDFMTFCFTRTTPATQSIRTGFLITKILEWLDALTLRAAFHKNLHIGSRRALGPPRYGLMTFAR